MNICFICQKSVYNDEYSVGTKARRKLVAMCDMRKDFENKALLNLESTALVVHRKCYLSYSDERCAAAVISRLKSREENSSTKSLDGTSENVQPGSSRQPEIVSVFDFEKCFICNGSTESDNRHPDRNPLVKTVTKPSIQERLIILLANRKDERSLAILSRIKDVDLVAVSARYHSKCIVIPTRDSREGSVGRSSLTVDNAMEYIYSYIEQNSDDCQFTVEHLISQIPEDLRPHVKTVIERLKSKYKNDILMYDVKGAGKIFCFKDTGRKLLSEAWYSNRSKDEISERHRVMREAGAIVREAIRSKFYSTEEYPATSEFFSGVEEDVPECLSIFLEEAIFPGKRKRCFDGWKKIIIAIAHSIIKATRPRSFLSKVLLGVGCFLKKKFASRLLIDTLAAIGFSCSYSEVELLELSCISREQPKVLLNGFSQWVADNADYNINTLDGHGSWHVMGTIQCVTPSDAISKEETVHREAKSRKSIDVAELAKIELVPYELPPSVGLNKICVKNLDEMYPNPKKIYTKFHDLIWIYGKWSCDKAIPGWNGFMEQITEGNYYDVSKILYLPFINAPPSENTTVNTTLLQACKIGNLNGQKTKFVTFDQQLYWKARDIIANAREDSELNDVVVRLGGFHLLMSFMGAIGKIMAGSGLEAVWGTIYAEGSIGHMLLGKSYSRAVRAHILTNLSLAVIVLDSVDPDETTRSCLDNILADIDKTNVMTVINDEAVNNFSQAFEKELVAFEERGPTAKLWVLYFRMTTLLKHFLEAERSGNWELHLHTIRNMLPFFHASGHFNYAKSAHLYLQDMALLEEKMTAQEFHRFTNLGYFTIRRSRKFFAGIFTDQTIEQTMMRLAKSHEGVTVHGRGITENVTAKWTMGMFSLMNICEQFEIFCDVYDHSSEQHIDTRPSRIARDNMDVEKMNTWFASHHPFPESQDIISIDTGVVGDKSIDCYKAEEKGYCMMNSMEGQTFGSLTLKRSETIKPLSNMFSSIKIKNNIVSIDPMLLFQRILISQPTKEDLQDYMQYELAPYPMSLFDEGGMRKGTKSNMYEAFDPLDKSQITFGQNRFYVIDGGYFLHKVKWEINTTITDICDKYIAYLQKRYLPHSCMVIFDGYSHDLANARTKSSERLRRSRKHVGASINFDERTNIKVSQETFLSNDENKDRFITIFRIKLENAGFRTDQAFEDADRLIVESAVQNSTKHDSVTIIGEDIDLLVLLTALGNEELSTYFLKPSHGKTPERIYSPGSFKTYIAKNHVLFIHAFSGCDTTSALYFQGKAKLITLLAKNEILQITAEMFKKPLIHQRNIEAAGQIIFVALYGGAACKDTLSQLRFKKFAQSSTKNKINLAALPPSPDAANLHSRRVYFQVQAWLGNDLDPLDWGWKMTERGLEPEKSTMEPAPENVMKLITCGCKTSDCGSACGCRKAGLLCSVACKYCGGENCSNVPSFDVQETEVDEPPSQVFHRSSIQINVTNENVQDTAVESMAETSSDFIGGTHAVEEPPKKKPKSRGRPKKSSKSESL